MRLEKITVAQNGFIITDIYGYSHIAKTLLEAAQIVGETIPNPSAAGYDLNKNATTLELVREEFKRGNKINAIKELRACFTPRLGLREAKELVETLCG